MKRKLQTITSVSAATLLALSVWAQDTPGSSKANAVPSKDVAKADEKPRADQLNGAHKASEIIGMTVKNYQDETLGKVEELAVDIESGRIVQVILSMGGYLGIGDTLTAVPPRILHYDVAHKVLHLDTNKDKMKDSPRFEMSKWVEYSDSKHLAEVYRYYGEGSAFNFIQKGDAVANDQIKPEGISDKKRMTSESQSMIPTMRLGYIQKASSVNGTTVKNLQDENIGTVDNLMVDISSGRVVAVIISSGGFLGMGDELSAVPPAALKLSKSRDMLQLDASKERLTGAPHFKSTSWPDLSKPDYADEAIYNAYNVAPYFTKVIDADNTTRNMRDRDAKTLTPLDQGSSKADVATTTQIRKEILARKDMSIDAQNVKVITINGRVTLRGPVNSVEEKRLIGDIATNIVRLENVDNQLEVKADTTSK